jgi:hypothetical protein
MFGLDRGARQPVAQTTTQQGRPQGTVLQNKEAWLKVHFYKESELQKQLVLLPDGYYSSAKRIIKAIDGKKHRTELDPLFSAISSCNESTYCSESNSWNCY